MKRLAGQLAEKGASKDSFFFERLRFVIREVEDDYDVVVLDTPPSLGFLTLARRFTQPPAFSSPFIRPCWT